LIEVSGADIRHTLSEFPNAETSTYRFNSFFYEYLAFKDSRK
jgi:hypothetical protein